MKITIIVGNGFDIGLGLKTSYSDFISEYADLSRPYDPYAIETKLKKLINRNKLSWADAEVAFARLSFDSILNDCKEFDRSFLNLLSGFQEALVKYLESEEKKFAFAKVNDDLKYKFIQQILRSTIEGLPSSKQGEFIEQLKAETVTLQGINFNYTRTFDALLPSLDDNFKIALKEGFEVQIKMGEIVHIHGTLKEKDAIFGVTDPQLIESKRARELCQLGRIFLKEYQDEEQDLKGYESAKNLVRDVDVVLIFGTSMGLSDSSWLNTLVFYLGMNDKLKIMLHIYSQNPKEINNGMDYTLLQKNGRELFIHSLSDRDDEIEMKSVWPKLRQVTTLLEGPYTRMDNFIGMGDPWDLSGLSKKLVSR
jgi:hypothetical protein